MKILPIISARPLLMRKKILVAMVESEKCKKQIRLCLETQALSKPPIIEKKCEDVKIFNSLIDYLTVLNLSLFIYF